MEWIASSSAWTGLAMLVAVEVVLRTENLARVDSRCARLPDEQRRRARYSVMILDLSLRVVLLLAAAWILGIGTPLFSVGRTDVSPRSLLLVGGGLLLIAKASFEIHRRLTATKVGADTDGGVAPASWLAVVQVAALDVVLSIDNVVTAVGMVEQVTVMVIAVVVAAGVSLAATRPILAYLARRPSVVVLCLAILIVVGFNLFLDGLGYDLPKTYLYTVIGLAFLVEAIGQFRDRDPEPEVAGLSLRQRTARRVLRLLGRHRSRFGSASASAGTVPVEPEGSDGPAFAAEEADMIQGVLTLAERPVRTIMSPRPDVQWIDVDGTPERVRSDILRLTHSVALLCRGRLNDFVGVAATTDLLRTLVEGGEAELSQRMRQPLVVHEGTKVLKLMEELRRSSMPMAVVVDEYGTVAGVATPTDILEAIAGGFPDRAEAPTGIIPSEDGSWIFEGFVDVHRASAVLDVDIVDASHRYTTLSGYIVSKLGDIPHAGQSFVIDGLDIEILAMKGRTIDRVRVRRHADGTGEPLQPVVS